MEGLGGKLCFHHVKKLLALQHNPVLKRIIVSTSPLSHSFSQNVDSAPENNDDVDEINKKRDVSRLPPALMAKTLHRRNVKLAMGNGVRAKDASEKQFQAWKRQMYGKYGAASGVDPATIWPSKERLAQIKEFEKECVPSLQDLIQKMEAKRAGMDNFRRSKETTVLKNMEKMPKWIEEHRKRLLKQDEEEQKVADKKASLLFEAREYYGYHVDPRDEKFKSMVQLKQEELMKQKKLMKRQKKKQKAEDEIQAQIQQAMEKNRKEMK